jgi:hypothetical protein
LAIRSAAVRSSAVGTEPRNQTVSRLTLTWMFLLFSPGAVCNFLTIRIFRSCEVRGSVDCSESAPSVGFGAEVFGGNVGGVAPRDCCATPGSDSANAITATNLLLFFIIPLHLRQLEREERPSTTPRASALPLIHTSTDFGVGVVRDASKSSPVVVPPVVLFVDLSNLQSTAGRFSTQRLFKEVLAGGRTNRSPSGQNLVTKGVVIESAHFFSFYTSLS